MSACPYFMRIGPEWLCILQLCESAIPIILRCVEDQREGDAKLMLRVDEEFCYWMLPIQDDWMSSVVGQPRVLLTATHTKENICIHEYIKGLDLGRDVLDFRAPILAEK